MTLGSLSIVTSLSSTLFFVSLFAQSTSVTGTEWTSVFALLTNIGFSAIVAWYLLSKAIPSIQDRFSHDLQSQRNDHDQHMVREREAFEKVISVIMDQRLADIKTFGDRIDRMSIKQDRLCELLEDVVDRLKARAKS